MRSLIMLMLVAACDQGRHAPTPSSAPTAAPIDAGVAVVADAAAAIDAYTPPPLSERRYASVAEFLSLTQKAPPDHLAGIQLGASSFDAPMIAIPGWSGWSHAIVRDGKVAHIIVELIPDPPSREHVSDPYGVEAMTKAIEKVEHEIRAAWGPPRQGTRSSWQGTSARLYEAIYGGFLRGSPSLVFDLVPSGDEHVCGEHDGFAPFFATFKKALATKDEAAIVALLDDRPDDVELAPCGAPDEHPGFFECTDEMRKRLPARPSCNVSREVYYWRTGGTGHGGRYFEFTRTGTTWKARGPLHIGHDDDPSPNSP